MEARGGGLIADIHSSIASFNGSLHYWAAPREAGGASREAGGAPREAGGAPREAGGASREAAEASLKGWLVSGRQGRLLGRMAVSCCNLFLLEI